MQYRDEPVLSFRPIDVKESKPQNVRRLVRLQVLIAVVLIALLVMLLTFYFLIRPVKIKSEAMEPTYPNGSTVFVTREWGTPERGEVAAFVSPADGSDEIYVRRVVAVGGDLVEIKSGALYVNGIAADEPYLNGQNRTIPDMGETTVPEGCVFVLGDNRSLPLDSPDPAGDGLVDLRSVLGVVRFSFGRK